MELVDKIHLPIFKLASIITDGALTSMSCSFVALCKQHSSFPDFVHHHSITHKQPFCEHFLNIKNVMDVAMKIVNSICV